MRIVVKFGTGVLTRKEGASLDSRQFTAIARQVAELHRIGHACILVSSGAVAAGVEILGLTERPADLPGKQACAAAGQPKLMRMYDMALRKHGLQTAQLLLTHDDIDSRTRRLNARNTLERLLRNRDLIPIINENDSVAVDEIRVSDNDRLSAEVAQLAEADLLLIATSTDGLRCDGVRVPVVHDFEAARSWVTEERGRFSTGGMLAKLDAVRLAVESGIETLIVDGRSPDALVRALETADVGTRFPIIQATGGPATSP